MVEINNKANFDIDEELTLKVVKNFLKIYHLEGQLLSLAFIDDNEIKEINKTYRSIDKTTDVLSFPSSKEEKLEDKFLGEILINYNQVKRQVGEYGEDERQEFIFILVHGLLHLLGYTDETEEDKKKMIKLGRKLIDQMNI